MNVPVNITKCCVECDKPSIVVPLITGASLELWCDDHIIVAGRASISRLGQRTHNFIFSTIKHDVWFWEIDIHNALQAALDTFFEEIADNLYNAEESICGLEELIRTKAKELEGVIKFSQQEKHTIETILRVWLSPGYINDIDGPLGKPTSDLIGVLAKGFVSPAMTEILTCMALSAKRAASYEGHDNSAVLIQVEQSIWESHRITIGEINV